MNDREIRLKICFRRCEVALMLDDYQTASQALDEAESLGAAGRNIAYFRRLIEGESHVTGESGENR